MKASRFFYDRFEIDRAKERVRFYYRTDAGHAFVHELSVAFPEHTDDSRLAPAAFALGMAELVHYWKAVLAPVIVVSAGALSKEQISFWATLYEKGLGEFFFVNKIDFRGLVRIECDPAAPVVLAASPKAPRERRLLVPLGGGKDSLVTGELLKRAGRSFAWFELEPLQLSTRLKELSEVNETVVIGRDVASNFAPVLSLVAEGAPNGHVPITATYMFSAAFAAAVHGFDDLIMSLERSADEGNVEYLGTVVNHQYSKSFEFEQAAAAYLREYVDPNLRLFSLVRPLYELQIVEEFAKHPKYFDAFLSCNRGLKTGSWCGTCAKCAFMFAALSAFLPTAKVVGVFGKNLFEDESLIPLYRELIGQGTQKPFDCVGTYDENLLALYLSGERYAKEGVPLPPVLSALPIAEGRAHTGLLLERGPSIAPPEYSFL